MKYACKIIKGKHHAVVENEDGEVLAVSPPCDSKFHAMGVRDRARNEGAAVPEGWEPSRPASEKLRLVSSAPRDAEPTPYTMEPRAMQEAVVLPPPEKFAVMSWPEKRALTASISNQPIRTKADAEAVYQSELERRGSLS